MSHYLTDSYFLTAEKIVAKARKNDGLAPVDLDRFWEDQEKAIQAPFSSDCPQLPLGVLMSNECVFAELAEPEDWYRLLHDDSYRVSLEGRYNDECERVVGKRLLDEFAVPAHMKWPVPKKLNEIFESPEEWHVWSYWIREAANGPDELASLLDRVERRLENLADFILPSNWASEKARLESEGCILGPYRSQRGPVTFAMSVYGVENLIYLILDQPDLAARFRDLILKAILERAKIIDDEAGFTASEVPGGWGWSDDNCAMLNAEMYEFFGYPIVKGVFDRYCTRLEDDRAQHSDSAMAHLLPLLGKLGLNSANFGPTLSVTEIREHLPNAIIRGQLAPFTFSRDEEVNLVAETLRDFQMSRENRGVVYSTAGSINNGSKLTGLRLIMSTIQQHCRY
ncbi:MAG: hypothetical protein HN368_09410 [Spirochaetales bacterium]|nr:hypothetical protein [Spirochaetales bacterium]